MSKKNIVGILEPFKSWTEIANLIRVFEAQLINTPEETGLRRQSLIEVINALKEDLTDFPNETTLLHDLKELINKHERK